MTVDATIRRATKELEGNRVWRAKEILRSSFATYGYSREIFESYADVVRQMGDDLEAGRFYLLSLDHPKTGSEGSINLFLSRFGHENYEQLLSKFPRCSRLPRRDDYPKLLRRHLAELGAPEDLVLCVAASQQSGSVWSSRILLTGCALSTTCILFSIVIGVREITSWFAN